MNVSPPPPGVTDPVEGQFSLADGFRDASRRLSSRMSLQGEKFKNKIEDVNESLGPQGSKALRYALLAAFVFFLRRLGQKSLRAVTVVTATALPLYNSFKALETYDSGLHKKWLTYWVCLGAYGSLEAIPDMFLGWVPSYSVLKLAFLVWMQRQGSVLVYAMSVRHGLRKVEESGLVEYATGQVERRVEEMRAGVERMQEGVKEIVEEEARKMRIEEV